MHDEFTIDSLPQAVLTQILALLPGNEVCPVHPPDIRG